MTDASTLAMRRPTASHAERSPMRVQAPPMEGRGVQLRRVTPGDYEFLYWLATARETGFRWRYRGMTPSPEEFTRTLWDGIFAQFIVAGGDGTPIGLVMAYGAHPRDGYVYLGAVAVPDEIGTGRLVVGTIVFIEYLFAVGSFRKVYLEAPEFNISQFGHGLHRYCSEEARLHDHEWYGDRWWDLVTLAIYRERWQTDGARLVRYALGDPAVDPQRPRREAGDGG